MKNWVFPVITGYEYHTNLANASDFTFLNGAYSYKELLNGETAGVILHFNHAERTEVFYYNYADSTTIMKTYVSFKTARLGLTDSSIVNGDMYMNNAAGDELGITPSGRDYTQRDFAVVQSIDRKDSRSCTSYKKHSFVQGTNEDRWGGHIVTAHNNDSAFVNGNLVSVQKKGSAIIDHVEFVNCSQYDTDKAAVKFTNFFALTSADAQSSATNSAIYNGLGTRVMITSADNAFVGSNAIFFHHIGGIWLRNLIKKIL